MGECAGDPSHIRVIAGGNHKGNGSARYNRGALQAETPVTQLRQITLWDCWWLCTLSSRLHNEALVVDIRVDFISHMHICTVDANAYCPCLPMYAFTEYRVLLAQSAVYYSFTHNFSFTWWWCASPTMKQMFGCSMMPSLGLDGLAIFSTGMLSPVRLDSLQASARHQHGWQAAGSVSRTSLSAPLWGPSSC